MKLKEHLYLFKRALRMLFCLEKRCTICMMLQEFLSSVTVYIPIYFSAKLIDALCAHAPLSVIVNYAVLTVGLVFAIKLLAAAVSSIQNPEEAAMYRNEMWMYSEKAMQMAYESIENPEVTRLLYRIKEETQTGFNRPLLLWCIRNLITNGTKIIASVAMSASFFALPSVPVLIKLALIAALFLILYVSLASASKIAKLQSEFWNSSVDYNVLSGQFADYIKDYSAGKDIRLYGMGEYLADAYLELMDEYYRKEIKSSYKKAAWSVPTSVLENVFRFGIYAVLIVTALSGEISVGSIAKYVSCIMMLIGAVTDMVRAVRLSFDNDHYLKRYFSYFDIPNNMYKGSLTVEKRDDREYDVEFRDVSFRYPNTESYALRHVSLKFKVGEKLAIVGENGSGKTTFIKLLCRLYDPTEGEILLNGVDIKKYDYDEYMSVFSVVFQDFTLFPFRLGEVVASGKDYEKERAEEALRKANFGERLRGLPDGADTYLYKEYDNSGVEISGGEAQKIALARALYKDAPFILLDEPTAALDPVSEYEVYSNFSRISGDRTAVYISHRLASCRFCDKIAVFDAGKLIQSGTHEGLLSDVEGKYCELWNAQAQYYTRGQGA